MPYDYDAIVVGGGAGGGTCAVACARAGKRVLLVERGERPNVSPIHNEHETLVNKKPYDDRPVQVNGSLKRLYAGGVLGGGTSLYGAALLRPSRDDFHPGRHYGERLPREIWDWPIAYDDLEPFYSEAESLYGLAGPAEDDFGPLEKPTKGFPAKPMALAPINRRLIAANVARGLKPFRLPLAINKDQCLNCSSCAGFACPTGARKSSAQLVDSAKAAGAPLEVMTGTEAECLTNGSRSQFDSIVLRERRGGRRHVYRARRYVIAAGAIGSPSLLLRSGLSGRNVGRHYMYHLSPIVVGLFLTRTGGDANFIKQVGFADFYFGSPDFKHKLGIVQSLPVPGPLLLAKAAKLRLPEFASRFLRRHLLPLAGIVEDLPNPENRVFLSKSGGPAIQHSFGEYDRERGQHLSRLMAKILKASGAMATMTTPLLSNEHVAHQCGTLRFGSSPAHAVADRDCRLFERSNTFVVDGSILPTSLGVGPALTIMANALRVTRALVSEL